MPIQDGPLTGAPVNFPVNAPVPLGNISRYHMETPQTGVVGNLAGGAIVNMFQAVKADAGQFEMTSVTRLTCLVSGTYAISASLAVLNSGTGAAAENQQGNVQCVLNGDIQTGTILARGESAMYDDIALLRRTITVPFGIIPVVEGDTVEFYFNGSTGAVVFQFDIFLLNPGVISWAQFERVGD